MNLRTAVARLPHPGSELLSIILLVIVAVVLFVQAHHPAWQGHLQTDVIIHHQQAEEYLDSGSWRDISFKEYQPGALWFFLIPRLLAGQDSYDLYRIATLFINGLLVLLHWFFFKKFGPTASPIIFMLLVGAMGPILLYRFDLIVSLMLLLAYWAGAKQKSGLTGLLLGLAFATKLYAIVLVPLYVMQILSERRVRPLLRFGTGFLVGVLLLTGPFLLWGGSFTDISDSIATYRIKPLSLESIYTPAAMALWQLHSDAALPLDSAHGIHGIDQAGLPVSLNAVTNFWIVPTMAILLILGWVYRRRSIAAPLPVILLLFVFVMTAKVLNPQYLWWWIVFLPLLAPRALELPRWQLVVGLSMASLLITQIIYPVFYLEYLDWFYGRGEQSWLFFLSLLRNIFLALVFIILVTMLPWRRQAI